MSQINDRLHGRRGRLLAPIEAQTSQGVPITVLPGECRIDEAGPGIRVIVHGSGGVGDVEPIVVAVPGSELNRWLNLRRLAFWSW